MVGLGGRQHAGRLVEDQDVGAAVERLEDLDPLLQPDRQLADDRVGIDLEPVVALEPLQLGPRPGERRAASRAPPSAPSMTFSSTVNGSTSMKCWWTMPMPAAIASCAAGDADRPGRRRGSRRRRPGRSRRGSTSASTCRRRSRRRCRGWCRAGPTRSMSRLAWTGAEALVDADAARSRGGAAAARRAAASRSPAIGAQDAGQALSLRRRSCTLISPEMIFGLGRVDAAFISGRDQRLVVVVERVADAVLLQAQAPRTPGCPVAVLAVVKAS